MGIVKSGGQLSQEYCCCQMFQTNKTFMQKNAQISELGVNTVRKEHLIEPLFKIDNATPYRLRPVKIFIPMKKYFNLKQRYARTGGNDKRVFTVEITVLGFWSALYRFGM